MKDTADELLQELESLDDSDAATPASDQAQRSESAASPLETLLEATQLAQEAAEEAQVAAERNLTLAKEEKESIIEMSEALGAWRHASRSAIEDVRAARRHMAIMMGVSLVFGAVAMGITGWMMYQIKYQAESAKADILDLMQTQFTLFNQKTGLKVDELASLIESMQAEVQRMLKESALGLQQHVAPVNIVAADAVTETHPAQPEHGPAPARPDAGEHHPTAGTQQAHEKPHETVHHAEASAHHKEPVSATPVHAATHDSYAPKPAETAHRSGTTVDTHAILARLDRLEKQLTALLKQQQHSSVAPAHQAAAGSQELAELRKLLLEQDKQLRIIRAALWKLRQKQAGAPQAADGSSSSDSDLTEIKQAIESLSEQVNQLRNQQEILQETLEKLKKETAKLNQPYRYKAPPLHLE
jgi:chaperonin cofactor prefoldin